MSTTPQVQAGRSVVAIDLSAKVIRCGCPEPRTVASLEAVHGRSATGDLLPCPNPRNVEDHGVIASWRMPRLIRWALAGAQWLADRATYGRRV